MKKITVGIIKNVGPLYGFVHKPAQSPIGWEGSDFYFKSSLLREFFLCKGRKVYFCPVLRQKKWRAELVVPFYLSNFFLILLGEGLLLAVVFKNFL